MELKRITKLARVLGEIWPAVLLLSTPLLGGAYIMLVPGQLWERYSPGHSSGPEATLFFCIMIAWVAIPSAAIILSMYGLSRTFTRKPKEQP